MYPYGYMPKKRIDNSSALIINSFHPYTSFSGETMRYTRLLCLFLLVGTCAFAQSFRGSISGTITDKTGAALSGSEVTVSSPQTGLTRTVTTDDSGDYSVPELPL